MQEVNIVEEAVDTTAAVEVLVFAVVGEVEKAELQMDRPPWDNNLPEVAISLYLDYL